MRRTLASKSMNFFLVSNSYFFMISSMYSFISSLASFRDSSISKLPTGVNLLRFIDDFFYEIGVFDDASLSLSVASGELSRSFSFSPVNSSILVLRLSNFSVCAYSSSLSYFIVSDLILY